MLQKSELLKVTVEDLDGELSAPQQPVNIMRERTFNPELSSLLNKIYSHEKIPVTENTSAEKADPGSKIALLQKCDQLIYTLKHKDEAASSVSEFNPFKLDINVNDDIDDLNDYIQSGMNQSGFEHFLIMKYNFKDAAFRTDLNRIKESLTSDLFLSIKDPLFGELSENEEGCILNFSSISEDPFMNKKFRSIIAEDNKTKKIYFVRLCSICSDMAESIIINNRMRLFEQYLSPVVAIIIEGDDETYSSAVIFEKLKRNMQIPFLLYAMKNGIRFDITGYSYEDALLILELFMNSPAGREMTVSILTLKNFSEKENLFILKYLISKIRKRLEENSIFLRISINKSILISSEKERDDIAVMIDEMNSGNSIISLESSDNSLNIDRNSFVSLFL